MRKISQYIFLIIMSALLLPKNAYADAIVIIKAMKASTIAEIFIEKNSIKVDLEIGMRDIEAFKKLLPDDVYEKLGNKPVPFKKRLKTFFKKDFVILADEKPLKGYITKIGPSKRIKRDEITGEPLPISDEKAKTVVRAVLKYPYEGQPKSITIIPPMDDRGYVNANIGFIAYHLDIPVNDFRYLSQKEILDIDWKDPWYSKFRNRNLWRQYSTPISAFIYIEPFEVRKEIIVRPKDLQQYWIDLGLAGKDTISAEDQAEIKNKVAAYFIERNPVFIDGKKAIPLLDRIHFIRRSLKMTNVIDPPEDLPIASATLGVIFVYPITGLPQEVAMHWELFNPRIQKINTRATDEAGGMPYTLTLDDSILTWKNFLKNPAIPALVDLKPPSEIVMTTIPVLGIKNPFVRFSKVPDKDVQAIVVGLLRNVYHAFDYREESDTYDVLAQSAAGDLLTKIYLETRRALELKNQGGAKVKVKEVAMVKNDTNNLDGEIGFTSNCTWNVSGSVGHWGHIHMRKNQYEASITVKAVDGAWKITDLEILNEVRL
jgi:hypothetical protein